MVDLGCAATANKTGYPSQRSKLVVKRLVIGLFAVIIFYFYAILLPQPYQSSENKELLKVDLSYDRLKSDRVIVRHATLSGNYPFPKAICKHLWYLTGEDIAVRGLPHKWRFLSDWKSSFHFRETVFHLESPAATIIIRKRFTTGGMELLH